MESNLSQLDQLKTHTIVVADTGDIDSIKQYKPTDATTNPSLILASSSMDAYKHLVDDAIKFAKENLEKYSMEQFYPRGKAPKSPGTPTRGRSSPRKKAKKMDGSAAASESASDDKKVDGDGVMKESNGVDGKVKDSGVAVVDEELLSLIMDKVAVNFGLEILKIVDGLVSTEVDARLSYDTDASVARAKRIIKLYADAGISKDRILIKLASTWEGFQAAKILRRSSIKCNMTLMFSFCQAVVAAEAKVELISPFVGRIRDWFAKNTKDFDVNNAVTDPGCVSVKQIYNYYKVHGYETVVMGASFRSKGEIEELYGCDKLTIGPKFLDELANSKEPLKLKMSPETAAEQLPEELKTKIILEEKDFRWQLNEDAMATEKLAEGIRNFAADIRKLEELIKKKLL